MTKAANDEDKDPRRSAGQWIIALFVVLALVASLLMVLGDDISWQGTLAVIAALWAAVIGAVLVTKYRRQADVAESRSRDLRLVYELQLEREIAARRQYESDVEASIRQELASDANYELDALKAQVLALRSSLEQLLGEPLPASRVAIGLERPRELGSGLSGASYAGVTDDRAAAERDFATTAPPAEAGRHVPDEVEEHTVDAVELTEIIPVVTEESDEPELQPEPQAEEPRRDAPWTGRPAPGPIHNTGPQQQAQPQRRPDTGPQQAQRPPQQPGPQQPAPQRPAPQQPPVPQYVAGPSTGGHQRAAYGAAAYQPPAAPPRQGPPTGPQQAPQSPAPQDAEPVQDDGAHVAGRPASELLSRLRESGQDYRPSSGGGRRRRD